MKIWDNIKKDIKKQFKWDNRILSESRIRIEIYDQNHVKLSGKVSSLGEKEIAGRVAYSVWGVRTVGNAIKVVSTDIINPISDINIKNSVNKCLKDSSDIDEAGVRLTVSGGAVKLEGCVPTRWQKMRVLEETSLARGVNTVLDKIAVVPTRKITDEIVGEMVMDKLEKALSAGVSNICAKVVNAEVTVSGEVNNWDRWRLLSHELEKIKGIKKIKDRIFINTYLS